MPEQSNDWMHTHASNPFAEQLGGTLIRIYFSCRDRQKRSSIGTLEIDLNHPTQIMQLSSVPVLSPGEPGYFDDSGVTMAWLLKGKNGQRYLYYLGWNLSVTVPFRNSIGLAVSDPETGKFCKFGKSAIMDRDNEDPLTISYPCVLRDNKLWRMWYGSHLSWNNGVHEMIHVLKYAESEDGISWVRKGPVKLPFISDSEFGISRPSILKEENRFRMWFSCRSNTYRIAYAESEDGINWERQDQKFGIEPDGGSGWDSESVEYSHVFSNSGKLFMLYNGNNYGATGFGLACLE